jgi:hypothetical protein
MGVNTDYLGHVEIVPNLNQAEYDYLHAFARSRRSYRPGGPYAVSPEDPDTGNGKREVELYNQIADGQPGYWCQWVPCPHGCCLVWNGHEKFYAGPAWLQYLIDHFLRRDAHARTSGDPQFTGFTFDHEMNGIIVGEQGDNRELFLLRVEANEVTTESSAEATLRCRGSRATGGSTTGPGWPASDRGGPAWTPRCQNSNRDRCRSGLDDVASGGPDLAIRIARRRAQAKGTSAANPPRPDFPGTSRRCAPAWISEARSYTHRCRGALRSGTAGASTQAGRCRDG